MTVRITVGVREVETMMRWLKANGVTHEASEIVRGSVYANEFEISYDVIIPNLNGGYGRHLVTVPHKVKPTGDYRIERA